MVIYTVSLNLLENIQDTEMEYLACILFNFSNREHPAKLAVDTKKIILSKYREIRNYKDIIKTWIDLLSNIPSSVEWVNVDLEQIADDEQMCLTLCSHTQGSKNMIVYSLSSLNTDIDEDNCACHNGCRVRILDRDEARKALNNRENQNIYIIQSQFAGGSIIDSNNINGNEE